jgi:hypothetical protein
VKTAGQIYFIVEIKEYNLGGWFIKDVVLAFLLSLWISCPWEVSCHIVRNPSNLGRSPCNKEPKLTDGRHVGGTPWKWVVWLQPSLQLTTT